MVYFNAHVHDVGLICLPEQLFLESNINKAGKWFELLTQELWQPKFKLEGV